MSVTANHQWEVAYGLSIDTDLDTLNDLERFNCPYFAFFSPNFVALQAVYVTVVEDRPIMSVTYCLSVPVFHFWAKLTHPKGYC